MRGTPLGIRLFTRPAVVVAGGAATTWDSANSSTDWSLDATSLIATRNVTTAGFWAMLRATSAKTNGTFSATVGAIGSGLLTSIGFDTGAETLYPGSDGSGHSVGYTNTGGIVAGGGTIATVASYTTGDVITCVKLGATFTFKKNGAIVYGPTDLTGTLGAVPVFGAAYPAASNGNGTTTQLTLDASGW